jgi:ribose 5-phosphate isomerase B
MKVFIASDHAGLALKHALVQSLAEARVEHEDLGPSTAASVDYPDFAHKVAQAVTAGQPGTLGVLVCGSGIGMSIAANKVKGVRAAVCRTELEARLAREHNDANVLCLGERITGSALARAILEAFLGAKFEGGRHERRVAKMEP